MPIPQWSPRRKLKSPPHPSRVAHLRWIKLLAQNSRKKSPSSTQQRLRPPSAQWTATPPMPRSSSPSGSPPSAPPPQFLHPPQKLRAIVRRGTAGSHPLRPCLRIPLDPRWTSSSTRIPVSSGARRRSTPRPPRQAATLPRRRSAGTCAGRRTRRRPRTTASRAARRCRCSSSSINNSRRVRPRHLVGSLSPWAFFQPGATWGIPSGCRGGAGYY
mmetsp:Transcript_57661/g.120549  ORF Transcript_57661/g.120549 Transcript_57661/m.120549 type:complete len:215 (-) Transcript_57661:71-715(-)